MQTHLPWILAGMSVALLLAAGLLAWLGRRASQSGELPNEWALTARPVFSADERRVYRQLREALPHHIVLSKLPLVRFCQPVDPDEVRYWYSLLGSIHVTFAICSANGRVLAAIDLDSDRSSSRRAVQIKHAVLGACRVRYLRCPVDHLPSVPELQLLVPQNPAASRGPQAAPEPSGSRDGTPPPGQAGRRRATLWNDSSFFHDSFFGSDSRHDTSPGEFSALRSRGLPPADPGDAAGEFSRPQPPLKH
jgi:hypothetical protein